MLQLIFLATFMLAIFMVAYLVVPKDTDLPGEAIFDERSRKIIKEALMKPIDWLAYQIDTRDKKCLEILEESNSRFLLKRMVAMVFLGLLGYLVGGYIGLIIGMIAGWFAPSFMLRAKYSSWQDAVAADIPTMVDYLIVYFSVGYNVKKALIEVVGVVGEELGHELERVNADIEISKDYRGALDRFSDRIENHHVDTVIQRLKSSWETKASADVFESVAESLLEIRKLRISVATAKYKIFMVILPILGVIGIIIMVMVPLAYWLVSQFGNFDMVTSG